MPTKRIHNWLQINQSSYTEISDLINREIFIPTNVEPCGPRGTVTYRLAPAAEIEVKNDDTINIADTEITAQLSHQPTHAYRAMVDGSANFEQFKGVNLLLRMLRMLRNEVDTQQFAELLENTVHRGRQPEFLPCLVVKPKAYTAVWLQQETYIRQTSQGHWMLSLSYNSTHSPTERSPEKVAVGLDLGLNPVTAAYTSSGVERIFPTTALTHLRELEACTLSPEAQGLLQNLTYASGRLDTERVVGWLNYHAKEVFAERLTHRDMNPDFIFRARDLAIHDHHYAALAQYLYTANVPFKRVSAWRTSRICPCCPDQESAQSLGNRSGDHFHCTRCGFSGNSHIVAARNILKRGLKRK